MSEPESFLARWTRLKREAENAAPANAGHAPSPRAEGTPPDPAPVLEDAAPTVDLSALPPIDEITATTDIRAYLAPGVPAELTRAALRRAWVADPTIRDFVGIAENQWDFNDPNGIPGFGPLEDAGRLVAQLLGDGQGGAAQPAGVPAPEASHEVASLPPAPATTGESASTDEQVDHASPSETDMRASAPIAAPQQVDRVQPAGAAIPRGHGGALPE